MDTTLLTKENGQGYVKFLLAATMGILAMFMFEHGINGENFQKALVFIGLNVPVFAVMWWGVSSLPEEEKEIACQKA